MDDRRILELYKRISAIYNIENAILSDKQFLQDDSGIFGNLLSKMNESQQVWFTVGEKQYILFYKNKKESFSGIVVHHKMNKANAAVVDRKNKSIYDKIGELVDFVNLEKSNLFVATNVLFPFGEEGRGIEEYKEHYLNRCRLESYEPIEDFLSLKSFGYEGNGNLFLYDNTGKVYKYVHDGIMNDSSVMKCKDVPAHTFYYIPEIATLNDVLRYIKDML